ncbi:MAG: polyphosphate kinase 2 family protein [Anaerolineaceae bacterium]|nr:polyphosphate kinase 2 family protein [Anaerolineaceae bacterium]MCB9099549.1 polyphosphate kinase 2 family protein [Anaerolineales bacterium]
MPMVTVKPGQKINLSKINPNDTGKIKNKNEAKTLLAQNIERMAELQNILYAQNHHALLIVLQAMDAGGKDGTIRSIMSGVNPQGVQVTSFKKPTEEELSHDFLWRIHRAVPARGMIGIFNRSHYEDVLVVRVHNLVPEAVWQQRYEHINNFERLLVDSRVTVLKFYLHISKDEQKERFLARLEQPHKLWKFNPGDLAERALWDDYMAAFETAFEKCSPAVAPWHIVPSNKKWYRNLVISQKIVETLEGLKLEYPAPYEGLDKIVID